MKHKPYFWSHYYRATPIGRMPAVVETMRDRSLYLHDVPTLCLRGAWELELRQFLPPMSLANSISSLMDMGLIEQLEGPQA